MRYSAILAALLVLWPLASRADEIYDNLVRFGLVGTWAIHCAEPVSAVNPRSVIYLAADGRVYRKIVRGGTIPEFQSAVESAKIVTPTTLATRWRNFTGGSAAERGPAVDMVIAKEGGRTRTVDSRGTDGRQFIRAGVIVSSGVKAPWMEKCG